MAWNAPVTFVGSQLVKASDLNEQLRDNMLVLKTPLDDTGKIIAISSTYFASLSGTAITGIPQLAATNTWTGKNDFSTGSGRLIVPLGTDKYAT